MTAQAKVFPLDIYIAEMSSAHNVCAKNHYLAIVSTIVETDNPQMEIKPGLDLLGPILDMYISVPWVRLIQICVGDGSLCSH
jgi:RAB protein geranylgeranyltransferase component A